MQSYHIPGTGYFGNLAGDGIVVSPPPPPPPIVETRLYINPASAAFLQKEVKCNILSESAQAEKPEDIVYRSFERIQIFSVRIDRDRER